MVSLSMRTYRILEDGLRVGHKFIIIEIDGGGCGLVVDKNGCGCCQRSVLSS